MSLDILYEFPCNLRTGLCPLRTVYTLRDPRHDSYSLRSLDSYMNFTFPLNLYRSISHDKYIDFSYPLNLYGSSPLNYDIDSLYAPILYN